MKNKRLKWILITIIMVTAIISFTAKPADAGTFGQATYNTPTPNADGQIIYMVQAGDNCTIIFLKTGISIDQIIALNNLGAECEVYESQPLILATVKPGAITPEVPVQTPTPSAPTPTPFEGSAEVCVVLFEDLDGNQMRSESEVYLPGGVISMNNRGGSYSETQDTIVDDPVTLDEVEMACFEEVPQGEYNLSMGIPDGYIATTSINYALTVSPGDTVAIDFGAQPSSQFIQADDADVQDNRSPLLLAIGLFLLAGGAGLTFFFIRSRQES